MKLRRCLVQDENLQQLVWLLPVYDKPLIIQGVILEERVVTTLYPAGTLINQVLSSVRIVTSTCIQRKEVSYLF